MRRLLGQEDVSGGGDVKARAASSVALCIPNPRIATKSRVPSHIVVSYHVIDGRLYFVDPDGAVEIPLPPPVSKPRVTPVKPRRRRGA